MHSLFLESSIIYDDDNIMYHADVKLVTINNFHRQLHSLLWYWYLWIRSCVCLSKELLTYYYNNNYEFDFLFISVWSSEIRDNLLLFIMWSYSSMYIQVLLKSKNYPYLNVSFSKLIIWYKNHNIFKSLTLKWSKYIDKITRQPLI